MSRSDEIVLGMGGASTLLEDLGGFVVDRIRDQLGPPSDSVRRWGQGSAP
jgi:hypothetical protein